jgi:tight adherence protein B
VVTVVAPYAIVLGVIGTIGLAVFALWERVDGWLERFAGGFTVEIERANLKIPARNLGAAMALVSVSLWLAAVVVTRPDVARAILYFPIVFAIAVLGVRTWLRAKSAARLKAFNDELELVLRLISSGLRVGLSLRQALVLVIEESPEPAKSEFGRVVAKTNIGVPMDAALAELVRRVPSDELEMLVDAIDVQSQTGGNLAKILDHLAATIKARRNIHRKVRSLTGEARMSGWVIGLLPLLLGAFVMVTQPTMRTAMLTTGIGHASLIAFVVLEILGMVMVRMMMRLSV